MDLPEGLVDPLHLDPLRMDPLHLDPLRMDPLRMDPLRMDPLRMHLDPVTDHIVLNVEDYLIGSEPSDSDIESSENGEAQNQAEDDDEADEADLDMGGGVSYIKLSYNDVCNHINKSYEHDIVHRYSSALDILASYIKGQKIIYMETRTHIVTLLNCLMCPALFISALLAVLYDQDCAISKYIMSGLAAFVTFLLALINYCKLEGAAEAHKASAYSYDKLQSFIEFQSGQVLLFSNPILNNETMLLYCEKEKKNLETVYNDNELYGQEENKIMNAIYQERLQAENELISNMRDHMLRIESDIADIKGTNQFIVPQKIRYNYPLLYSTNVFSVIKKIDDYKAKTLTDLKHIKNELRYIRAYMKKYAKSPLGKTVTLQSNSTQSSSTQSNGILIKYKRRSTELFKQKKTTINTILFLKTAFSMIDKMFQQEILNAKLRRDHFIRFYLYDLLQCCCIEKVKFLLPPKYIEPELSGGDIFADIMGVGVSS
jgi:hypothetical protein